MVIKQSGDKKNTQATENTGKARAGALRLNHFVERRPWGGGRGGLCILR